jgi:hypothetical protein
VRLRAQFTVDIEVEDYVEAADHQRAVEGLFRELQQRYPQAEMSFRPVREISGRRAPVVRPATVKSTGRLSAYD